MAGPVSQHHPDDLEAARIAIQAVRIPASHLRWLEDWDGSAVCSAGAAAIPPLKGEQLRRLMTQPELCLLPHEDGRLLDIAPGEFATPPRPTDRGLSASREAQDFVQPIEDKLPSDLELWAQYEEEKARNQDSASAIALVSSAYDCEPNHVRAAVMRCLERDSAGVEQVDPTREATSLSTTAPGLVKPRATTVQNPLLASSSAASRVTGALGPAGCV